VAVLLPLGTARLAAKGPISLHADFAQLLLDHGVSLSYSTAGGTRPDSNHNRSTSRAHTNQPTVHSHSVRYYTPGLHINEQLPSNYYSHYHRVRSVRRTHNLLEQRFTAVTQQLHKHNTHAHNHMQCIKHGRDWNPPALGGKRPSPIGISGHLPKALNYCLLAVFHRLWAHRAQGHPPT
jgi:hypothetical protein